jgi:UDP-N-acetylmuramoyl-tripeptide--D-alanyl-D-alanine ligase
MAEPLWTWAEVAEALGQPPSVAPEGSKINGVSIDSRTVQPGDLFVAIKGDRMDGHAFVKSALEKGAAAAIVERDFQLDASPDAAARLFRVEDTLEALNALGRAARARSDAAIVAVTGSVGKTGTKEMLRVMLGASGATHASEKSYNNLWGVPLSLARMPREARFGVFEIGMNHAGEIIPLTQMVRPHAAIITWVAPVHIEFFNSVAEIADAKAEILEGLEQGGCAILPGDNEHFARLAAHARQKGVKIIAFGAQQDATARLISFEPTDSGSRMTVNILGEQMAIALGVPGRHIAGNAVGALSAVKILGGDLEAAAAALASFEAPEGRGRRSQFEISGEPILVIDETYNANPASMRAALQVLGSVRAGGFRRRIAVLGDMLELGHASAQFHAELASAIDSNGIDLVFCAGPLMAQLYDQLPPQRRGALASTSTELCPSLLEAVQGGDAVMVKGSLGSKMGLVADALRSRFTKPARNDQGRSTA